MFNLTKYPQNAVDLVSHRYSLDQTVLLSYSAISHCSLLFKTFPYCLIQATYYHVSTHRLHDRALLTCSRREYLFTTQEYIMRRFNTQLVQIHYTDKMIIIKAVKYLMFTTITGSCLYSAMVLHAIASRLL